MGFYRDGNDLQTRAIYSTGAVTVPDGHAGSGGLIGLCRPDPGDDPKASYWDTEASGVSTSECGAGRTTAQLQTPIGYAGIYSSWNLDIDGDGTGDDPWDFGTSSQYPVLKYCADKPGIDTADGQPYCPLQPAGQRSAVTALSVPDTEEPPAVEEADTQPGGYTVDPGVVAKVQALAGQSHHGSAHVNRWSRVLVAFGAHDGVGVSGGAMTAAEAQQMADRYSSLVWDEVAAELTALEASAQHTPPPPPPPAPAVSITGSADVTEGDPVSFTVTASPAPAADLTVSVTVATTGDYGVSAGTRTVTIPPSGTATLTIATTDDSTDEADGAVTASGDFGAATGQRTVTIPTSGSVTLTIATTGDSTDEPDGSVTATLVDGAGYDLDTAKTAQVTVSDDDDPPPVEQDGSSDTVLADCGSDKPTLSISSPAASRSDATVDFEVSLGCIPAGRPMILVTPVRDGDITHNMFVAFSAETTTVTVAVDIGAEHRLGLALVWSTGIANRQAQGDVTWTDETFLSGVGGDG